MPVSDLVIAKRTQSNQLQWKLFDAFKFNLGYDIEINENGMIQAMENGSLTFSGTNFSPMRRQNLKGVNVNCGLVVKFGGVDF